MLVSCTPTSASIVRSVLQRSTTLRIQIPLRMGRRYSKEAKIQSKFTFRIAAASAAKQTPPRSPKSGRDFWNYTSTEIDANPPYLRSAKRDSGEDAFFATSIGGSPHHVAFGVADGVGGWQDQGIDPSEFSHGLCGLMAGTAHLYDTEQEEKPLRPQKLLQVAYDAVMGNPRILAGGSTASLAIIDEEGAMETANLGDSGFLILSPNKVAFRSPIQTHAFNTPWQMAKIPARMKAQYTIFGGGNTQFSETPSQAEITRHRIKHGDIVLFATDGVWDNLSAQDTLGIVTRIMTEQEYWVKEHHHPGAETLLDEERVRAIPKTLQKDDDETFLPGLLATAVMREAKVAGLDRRRDGPFAKEVNMHYPQEGWEGGKPDDIAVVVCVAVQETDPFTEQDEKVMKAKL